MNKMSRPLISIVSPAYCEEENVPRFHEEVSQAVEGNDFDIEFVFVNDGSTDATLAELVKLSEIDERVRVVNLSRNFGSLAALTAGLYRAQGDAIIMMAIDLQDPPELIPRFVDKWRQGHDIIWGVRESRDDPFLKSLLANSFYWVIRKLVFPDYPQGGTDTGLFSRRVIDIYRSLPERDSSPFYSIFSYGFDQAIIGYHRRARIYGTSGWPFWKRVKNAIDVITSFSFVPIRFISVCGLLSASAALLGGVFIVINALLSDAASPGWPSLAILILFIGGLQMLLLGVLAEYVWRIGEQTRNRPRYIVQDIFETNQGQAEKRSTPDLDILNLDVSQSLKNRRS